MLQSELFNPPPPLVNIGVLLHELQGAKLLASPFSKIIASGEGEIVTDSRRIKPGCVYIAIKGQSQDGHKFIKEAALEKAALVLCEEIDPQADVAQVQVRNSREAWAWACSLAFGHPGSELKLIGVTGTNGKTSTVWMIRCILEAFGIKSATVGTLGFYCGNDHFETTHTTPDPPALYAMLRAAKTAGCAVVAMEVSSHALVQRKLAPLRYGAAGMTSFSQDHLDLHGTMENYFSDKMNLFNELLIPGSDVFFHESLAAKCANAMGSHVKANITTYGYQGDSDVLLTSTPATIRGSTQVSISQTRAPKQEALNYQIPFIGHIFVENFAASLIACRSVCPNLLDSKNSLKISEAIRAVPGRLQPVRSHKPWRPLVLVDYAHTPDALEKSLQEARSITDGRLICVFGCGGDRDKSKRSVMGEISSRLADFTFITNDNPRTEDPEQILQEIAAGIQIGKSFSSISDRAQAISAAIKSGGGPDTVLIAGKGHEDYQIIGREKRHFSDVEEAFTVINRPRNWCIIGAGVSGRAAALYLKNQGESVHISDGGSIPSSTKDILNSANIKFFDGGHALEHLSGVDSVAVSPGISETNIILDQALKSRLPTATEIDLGMEFFKGILISVTGTNGKSTTCALIEHALGALGKNARACGNIGLPPTALAPQTWDEDSFWICELSSYQLERSHKIPTKVAIFTSFSFDHLARHGSLRKYFECKWRAVSDLGPDDLVVLRSEVYDQALRMGFELPAAKIVVVHDQKPNSSQNSPLISHWWIQGQSVVRDGEIVSDLAEFSLSGTHNAVNAAFCLATIHHLLALPFRDITKSMNGFSGLPYRCQLVGKTAQGHTIINDSKSTNLESTLIALSACDRPVVLLMGGAGKGESYKDLDQAKQKIAALISFGASREEIKSDAPLGIICTDFLRMQDAVEHASSLAAQLNCGILFSPGCASFDEFRNYEHRGEEFNRLILPR